MDSGGCVLGVYSLDINIKACSNNFLLPHLVWFRTCKHDNLSKADPVEKMTSFKFFRPYLYGH